jgi:hypothetical protein
MPLQMTKLSLKRLSLGLLEKCNYSQAIINVTVIYKPHAKDLNQDNSRHLRRGSNEPQPHNRSMELSKMGECEGGHQMIASRHWDEQSFKETMPFNPPLAPFGYAASKYHQFTTA